MPRSLDDLIAAAQKDLVTDGYGFAEWLTDDQGYFGRNLTDSELELAYEQGINWWNNKFGLR